MAKDKRMKRPQKTRQELEAEIDAVIAEAKEVINDLKTIGVALDKKIHRLREKNAGAEDKAWTRTGKWHQEIGRA